MRCTDYEHFVRGAPSANQVISTCTRYICDENDYPKEKSSFGEYYYDFQLQ